MASMSGIVRDNESLLACSSCELMFNAVLLTGTKTLKSATITDTIAHTARCVQETVAEIMACMDSKPSSVYENSGTE